MNHQNPEQSPLADLALGEQQATEICGGAPRAEQPPLTPVSHLHPPPPKLPSDPPPPTN